MAYESYSYYWIVICKNNWFHRRRNLFAGHAIPLVEADYFSPPPALDNDFAVRCDECGKQHLYCSGDLLRAELELGDNFVAHPLFLEENTEQPRRRDAGSQQKKPESYFG